MSTPPYQPQFPPPYGQHQAPKGPSWRKRHPRWTVALIVFGALTAIGGIANATGHGAKTPAAAPTVTATATAGASETVKASAARAVASSRPSTAASPSCLSQVKAWINGGSSRQLGALQSDMSAFSAAAKMFASDNSYGGAPAGDVSAVQNAAASIQADAQAIEADPAPACVPGMRPALDAAATDYSKAAIDAGNAMGQYSAGADGSALADLQAAGGAANSGTGEITAATTAAEKFAP